MSLHQLRIFIAYDKQLSFLWLSKVRYLFVSSEVSTLLGRILNVVGSSIDRYSDMALSSQFQCSASHNISRLLSHQSVCTLNEWIVEQLKLITPIHMFGIFSPTADYSFISSLLVMRFFQYYSTAYLRGAYLFPASVF